ncbi:sulfotransferase domain-containing protein [Winogradskyella poriferorum]|uniref:sulfotransferase domain-containing protein n=1 Tax=Winogradskyella poriferorum TaxID=307627 RepID=UPI003D657846
MILKKFKNKVENLTRLIFVNTLSPINNSIVLVEYPKSGGTWLGQLISSYFNISFPRNRFPSVRRILYHGHYKPIFNIKKNKHIVLLVRDGRDVMVSLYHHQLLWNDKNRLHPKDVIYHRKNVPFDDFENVKKNMKDFIRYTFTANPSKLKHFTYQGNWRDFNNSWLNVKENSNNIYLIKYEDLLKDTDKAMSSILIDFFKVERINKNELEGIINKYSFENQANRKKGEESKSSFLRKGVSGDWKNYFDEDAEKEFLRYSADTMKKLGYIN